METLPSREQLLDLISKFPENPGVYLMKNAAGETMYIGKAVNLKARVRSYFSDLRHETRAQIPFMLEQLASIDWIATTTESEALILESNLIRRHKPHYNIDLRDDKHFPYIKVSTQEPFPRLTIVRKVLQDGARYFGPYTDALAMRRLASFAKKIFKLPDCAITLPPAKPVRPCINYSMGRCSGPCAAIISREAYRARINDLLKFLVGRRNDLCADLGARMAQASAEQRYEEAAGLRDLIQLIRDAARLQQVDLKLAGMNCDVFGIAIEARSCCLAVLHFRDGLLWSSDSFIFKRALWLAAPQERDGVIVQYYMSDHRETPPEIVLPPAQGFDPAAIAAWFESQKKNVPCPAVTVVHKGPRLQLTAMAEKNARLHLLQKVVHDGDADCDDLQKALTLTRRPSIIEAFDISNLQASFCVAGMVRFVNGEPDKKGYRRYKIKTVEGQDDFAMMMEVVSRRLQRLTKENAPFPDLLLIDGGKGQLHAAWKAIAGFPNPPEIIALAKKEEAIFSPHRAEPVKLPPMHPARKLVERIRNEVHRYAVSYHRNIRGKQFKGSALETIAGVGAATARQLIKTFGSIKRLSQAAPDDIAKIKGVTLHKAIMIKNALEHL